MSSSRPVSHPGPSSSSNTLDLRATVSKLQQENSSLKRRLVHYATTLDQLTGHAKREISSSARARDDAIAAAADAAALRQTVSELTAARDRSERSARDSHSALADRTASLTRATEEVTRLRARLAESDTDKVALRDTRDALVIAERRILTTDTEARGHLDRVKALEAQLEEAGKSLQEADRTSRDLTEVSRHRDDLADKADRASREATAAAQRDAHAKAQIARLKDDIERLEGETTTLRSAVDERSRAHAAAEERSRIAERDTSTAQMRLRETESRSDETVAALRRELDEVLKEIADRNSELAELRSDAAREIDDSDVVQERDTLRISVRDMQEEIEQSTEMLTRAAIDALADKSRIRKLEDALAKVREEATIERRERSSRDVKISGMTEEIATFERQIDSLRSAKRSLTDECHRYQLQLHEKDKAVQTKTKELETIGTERNDRAFHADRLSLELSNAKNALAKKESDYMTQTAEYNEVCEQIKSHAKDLEATHVDLGQTRRELATHVEKLAAVTQEKERLEATAVDLQAARHQVQELSASVAEKEEELTTVKRWYSTLKTEAGEAAREKKRLSDLLSEVSADLQRANHELDLLRAMRKEQEALAARISHIGETSSRELNSMKQSQAEQAERLARNTVDEYQRRLEEAQMNAKDDIAQSVTEQLRHDIMPHLMRVVDMKAKNMVQALARHVETFSLDDGDDSYTSSKHHFPPSQRSHPTEDGDRPQSPSQTNTNVATASASLSGGPAGLLHPSSGTGSETRSIPGSAYRSAEQSYQQSHAPASTADSRWNSVLDASRVDSVEGSTTRASGTAREESPAPSPEPSVERAPAFPDSPTTSRTETPTERRSEAVEEDLKLPAQASRDIDLSETTGGVDHGASSSVADAKRSKLSGGTGVALGAAAGVATAAAVAALVSESREDPSDSDAAEEADPVTEAEDLQATQITTESESPVVDPAPLEDQEVPVGHPAPAGYPAADDATEDQELPADEDLPDVVEMDREIPVDDPALGEDPSPVAMADDTTASRGLDEVLPTAATDGTEAGNQEEDEVEELDITDNNNLVETDDEVGVDIEMDFDPRELMRQGVFAAVVNELVQEEDGDDYDEFDGAEGEFDTEGREFDGEDSYTEGDGDGQEDLSMSRDESMDAGVGFPEAGPDDEGGGGEADDVDVRDVAVDESLGDSSAVHDDGELPSKSDDAGERELPHDDGVGSRSLELPGDDLREDSVDDGEPVLDGAEQLSEPAVERGIEVSHVAVTPEEEERDDVLASEVSVEYGAAPAEADVDVSGHSEEDGGVTTEGLSARSFDDGAVTPANSSERDVDDERDSERSVDDDLLTPAEVSEQGLEHSISETPMDESERSVDESGVVTADASERSVDDDAIPADVSESVDDGGVLTADVSERSIGDDGVTPADISEKSVGDAAITADASERSIDDGGDTPADVSERSIDDGGVTPADVSERSMGDGGVTPADVSERSVDDGGVAPADVSERSVDDDGVTPADVSEGSVDDGGVTPADVSERSIDDGGVTPADVSERSIDDGGVTPADVSERGLDDSAMHYDPEDVVQQDLTADVVSGQDIEEEEDAASLDGGAENVVNTGVVEDLEDVRDSAVSGDEGEVAPGVVLDSAAVVEDAPEADDEDGADEGELDQELGTADVGLQETSAVAPEDVTEASLHTEEALTDEEDGRLHTEEALTDEDEGGPHTGEALTDEDEGGPHTGEALTDEDEGGLNTGEAFTDEDEGDEPDTATGTAEGGSTAAIASDNASEGAREVELAAATGGVDVDSRALPTATVDNGSVTLGRESIDDDEEVDVDVRYSPQTLQVQNVDEAAVEDDGISGQEGGEEVDVAFNAMAHDMAHEEGAEDSGEERYQNEEEDGDEEEFGDDGAVDAQSVEHDSGMVFRSEEAEGGSDGYDEDEARLYEGEGGMEPSSDHMEFHDEDGDGRFEDFDRDDDVHGEFHDDSDGEVSTGVDTGVETLVDSGIETPSGTGSEDVAPRGGVSSLAAMAAAASAAVGVDVPTGGVSSVADMAGAAGGLSSVADMAGAAGALSSVANMAGAAGGMSSAAEMMSGGLPALSQVAAAASSVVPGVSLPGVGIGNGGSQADSGGDGGGGGGGLLAQVLAAAENVQRPA